MGSGSGGDEERSQECSSEFPSGKGSPGCAHPGVTQLNTPRINTYPGVNFIIIVLNETTCTVAGWLQAKRIERSVVGNAQNNSSLHIALKMGGGASRNRHRAAHLVSSTVELRHYNAQSFLLLLLFSC